MASSPLSNKRITPRINNDIPNPASPTPISKINIKVDDISCNFRIVVTYIHFQILQKSYEFCDTNH